MPAAAGAKLLQQQAQKVYPYQTNQSKPYRSNSDQPVSKKEVQKAFSVDELETKRRVQEILDAKKKEAELRGH